MGEACSTCGERTGTIRVLVGRDKGKTPLETTRLYGILILKRISKQCDRGRGAWTGLIWLRIETVDGRL
jgi:hypothetical protein